MAIVKWNTLAVIEKENRVEFAGDQRKIFRINLISISSCLCRGPVPATMLPQRLRKVALVGFWRHTLSSFFLCPKPHKISSNLFSACTIREKTTLDLSFLVLFEDGSEKETGLERLPFFIAHPPAAPQRLSAPNITIILGSQCVCVYPSPCAFPRTGFSASKSSNENEGSRFSLFPICKPIDRIRSRAHTYERCGDFCEGVNPGVNPVQFEMPGLSESGQLRLIFSLLHLFTPGASRYQPFLFPLALSANNEKILVPLLHSLSIRFIPSPSARTCERTQSVLPCSLPCNLGQWREVGFRCFCFVFLHQNCFC